MFIRASNGTTHPSTTIDIDIDIEENELRNRTAAAGTWNTNGKAARQARERQAARGRQNAAKGRQYDFRKGGFRR